ncbi:MurR/RpiR family transcriptional regulator [Marimonas arenosa]|uniref:MurR/RpiR family transcriptional regulator n=1 Tax=Marimonas arenosa TaxID=1795305 RepID=A0AAE4B4H5_9RHOB|nr:MurR/RpiR family transcriptional regulator [Marimonas arenosa]MDQ2090230.1 MurR/RpiR family transcriptional regulator [Marimonas arenosa]
MDPTLKSRTIARLKAALPELSPQMRTAAKYIVDHQGPFGIDSIRATAKNAGVSTYSLIRLAERLGFSGFDDLRAPFRHALATTGTLAHVPGWIEELRRSGATGQVLADAAHNTLSVVQTSLERQSPEAMERAVSMALGARKVYLTAMRSSWGLAYHFHYIGRMALTSLELIPHHMNSAIDDLNASGPDDALIAITVTPYSRETIEACEFAQSRGVKLILITDSEVMASNFSPEVTLVASTISTHHFGSFAGVMAVLETLLAILVKQGGDAAAKRIASYEALRREHNVYWSAQAKR